MRRLGSLSGTLLAALFSCRQAPPAPSAATPEAPAAAPKAAAPTAAAPAAPAAAPDQLTLLFAASTAGQLVPCGCSPDQRGGLPRAVAYVAQVRKQQPNVLFADAGDLLFESGTRPNSQLMTQKKLKAQTLAQQEALMGAAARALGPRDLALGGQFALDAAGPVPVLDAGVAPVQGARAYVLADAGTVKVGLFAAGSQEDAKKTIAARAQELRAKGAQLVVMLAVPQKDGAFAAAQAMLPAAKAAGVDLVVLGHLDDPASDLNRRDTAGPPLLAVEGHGQSLLRLDVHLGKGPLALAPTREDSADDLKILDARIARFKSQLESNPARKAQLAPKIDELAKRRDELANAPLPVPAAGSTWAQVSYVPMGEKLASDGDGQRLVDTYDQAIADINLKEAKLQPEACPPAAAKEAAYVGAASCATCHDTEATFWSQTRHAHAYETLVAVKKQYSLDCITCHVTGWQQPGGVCRIDRTSTGSPGIGPRGQGRQDVQCEACHGAGSLHADDPNGVKMKESVPAAWCMRCHEPANSPRFDDAKYRPFIIGPGHGMPLARGEKPQPKAGGPNQ